MMTMSLGDEAPWIYLPGGSRRQGQAHGDLVAPSSLYPHMDATCFYRAALCGPDRVLGTEDTEFNTTVLAHDMGDLVPQHVNDPKEG